MLHALFDIPWRDLFTPTHVSWLEKAVRPFLVYLILFAIFRLIFRRVLAQATLFDFLVLLLISNVVQNAMIGPDDSVLGAAVGAVVLVGLSFVLDWGTARSATLRETLEGHPVLLVKDGEVVAHHMRYQSVSDYDLYSALRKQGIARLADVGRAYLELDGSISVIRAADIKGTCECLPEEIG